ncbi:MAG: polyprenyl diphosphate synthase [Planctomycetota bacterium]
MSEPLVPPAVLPEHIAIIMDGNGRWASERGFPRIFGHENGVTAIREVTTECARLGIQRLTLYAFSQDNWKRPKTEVAFLMRLLKRFVIKERAEIMDNGIRLTAIGRLHELPTSVQRQLQKTCELSAGNRGTNLCLALSYGGRAEITDAVRALARQVRDGRLEPDQIDEHTIASHLYQPGRDPDLLIRTAGEMRVSDFLLWQISYCELFVTQRCWPDFRKKDLHEALHVFARRVRKFGALPEDARDASPSHDDAEKLARGFQTADDGVKRGRGKPA